MVGMEGPAAEGADLGDRRRLVIARKSARTWRGWAGLGAAKSRVLEGRPAVLSGILEWQRAQLSAKTAWPRPTAPCRIPSPGRRRSRPGRHLPARPCPGGLEVGLVGFGRGEKIEHVLQAVFDGPEIGGNRAGIGRR